MGALLQDFSNLESKSEMVAEAMKHFSHPKKLMILCALSEKELTVSELIEATGLSQSHLSQTLTRFKSEGLVSSRKDGRMVYYSLEDVRIKQMIMSIQKIFCS